MNLSEITGIYLQQFPGGAVAEIRKQERLLERFGQIAFGGFGLVILAAVIGIIYVIITKMILSGANLWSGILVVSVIVLAVLARA